ncbi:hypothetical protein CEXT_261861 [Caerostris extrusa]|uniref:BPTI/Kunitz inhibitor domain-containing protein n=1 Tax=Caerostris extrusa TaxID=172846 RepID=A0AAV4VGR9_CAEEX|nr:hypothetical protein CEXT_261861 [Caerostris extrusa]
MRTSIFFLCVTFLGTTFADREDMTRNCVDPPDAGTCKGHYVRWNYDALTGKCNKFVYSGCNGNRNRYNSKALCFDNCTE